MRAAGGTRVRIVNTYHVRDMNVKRRAVAGGSGYCLMLNRRGEDMLRLAENEFRLCSKGFAFV